MAAIKYSRQRESIKEFLQNRYDHPTADTIYDSIRTIYPNISLGNCIPQSFPFGQYR